MLHFRWFPLLSAFSLGAALGCADGEADCDPQTEILVLYGSDTTDQDDKLSCEAAPASCGDAPDCECLRGQRLANGWNLDFCLDPGECDDDDDVVYLVCPGG